VEETFNVLIYAYIELFQRNYINIYELMQHISRSISVSDF